MYALFQSAGPLNRILTGCLLFSIVSCSPSFGKRATGLSDQERATHALNRLAFGPRPGDVEKVRAIGVKKWVALQLDPERIDDSQLDARLQNFPAMRLSEQALLETYPSPAIIRGVAEGRLLLPADPVVRAIYQNQIFNYEQKRQKDELSAVPKPGGSSDAMAASLEEDASSPSMTVHEEKLYADLASTQIVNLPAAKRLDRMVHMQPGQLRGFLKSLTPEEKAQLTAGMTARQKETVVALINPTMLVAGELLQTRLLTDLYSQRQLQAVMTDFWLNHFNVYLKKGPFAPWYLVDYQQNIIAPHAMGKFEDLLVATAKSPAMLYYLDNYSSIGPHSAAAERAQMSALGKNKGPGLNENYARELLELHTLGVDGGYTQNDVTEVARVFTGWTIAEPRVAAAFQFNERRHEPGTKVVMGQTISENGEHEGLMLMHRLATSPITAHHISQQLAERFVSDTPPPALVNRMARTWVYSGGDIRQVLRTLFTSPEFWSRAAYRAKVKTPQEFVLSAVRASGGNVERPAAVLNAMGALGMPYFGCQTPNGYSWSAGPWVNAGDLLSRIHIALAISSHKLGTATNLDALMHIAGPDAMPAAGKEAKLEVLLLQRSLNAESRQAVLAQAGALSAQSAISPDQEAGKPAARQAGTLPMRAAFVQVMDLPTPIPAPADKGAALIAGLLLGSPDFQRR